MRDLTARALNLAQVQGANYADMRTLIRRTQSVAVRNGAVEVLTDEVSQGFGVRVIVDGAWGFASAADLSPAEVERTTARAVRIARASARVQRTKVVLGPPEPHQGTYRTPVEIDPFAVPLEEKIALLLACDEGMRRSKGVTTTQGSITSLREDKVFASTEGAYQEQTLIETGAGLLCLAVGNGEVQQRSFPNSFGRHQQKAGYEAVLQMRLVENAPRIGEEAVRLLSADPCPAGVTTIILDATQLALQLHESCGHPIELDRALGDEAGFMGTSFLTPEMLHSFRYGSELVNITADATIPGALGTFGWDDEGVPAQRTPIVRHGIFVGYLSGRESAARIGQRSSGAGRADGWNRIPLVRMTNVNLEPGTWEFDDLIADTDEGIYMETNRSWSIDAKRLNFQFGTEVAYEIKGGKFTRLLRNATYTGHTPDFWRSCDAICNANHWRVWGTPNCGKGEPMQIAHVGHGTAPARFRRVRVGVMR